MRETVWRNGSRELNNNREADPVSGPDSRELTPRGGSNFQPRCDECVHKDFFTEDKIPGTGEVCKSTACFILQLLDCHFIQLTPKTRTLKLDHPAHVEQTRFLSTDHISRSNTILSDPKYQHEVERGRSRYGRVLGRYLRSRSS